MGNSHEKVTLITKRKKKMDGIAKSKLSQVALTLTSLISLSFSVLAQLSSKKSLKNCITRFGILVTRVGFGCNVLALVSFSGSKVCFLNWVCFAFYFQSRFVSPKGLVFYIFKTFLFLSQLSSFVSHMGFILFFFIVFRISNSGFI
jgi:hypothetical protein